MKLYKSIAAVYPKQITYSYSLDMNKTTCRCLFAIFINNCFDDEDKKYIQNIITDYIARHTSIKVVHTDKYDRFMVKGTSRCVSSEKFDKDFGRRLARARAKEAMNLLFFRLNDIIEKRGSNLASHTTSSYFFEQMNEERAYQQDIIEKHCPPEKSTNMKLPKTMTLYYTKNGQKRGIQGKKDNICYNGDFKHPYYITYEFPNFNLIIDGDSEEDLNEKVRRYFDVQDVWEQ